MILECAARPAERHVFFFLPKTPGILVGKAGKLLNASCFIVEQEIYRYQASQAYSRYKLNDSVCHLRIQGTCTVERVV